MWLVMRLQGPGTYLLLARAGMSTSDGIDILSAVSDDSVHVEDTHMDNVHVRVFTAKNRNIPSPALVYMHGGGFTCGDIGYYDPTTRYIAKELGILVISIAYRKSPEYPFPVPMDDCFRATVNFLQIAQKFGVDTNRIGVAGDSAGGNLAAAVSLRLRDEHIFPKICLTSLVYPMLQAIDLNTPAIQEFGNDVQLSKDYILMAWAYYSQGHAKNIWAFATNNHTSSSIKKQYYHSDVDHSELPAGFKHRGYKQNREDYGDEKIWNEIKETILNPYFAPLLATDLTGLPKTFVLTVGNDVLRDDGVWYAQRLKKAGNDVTHFHYQAGFHGIMHAKHTVTYKDSEIAFKHYLNYLKDNLF